MHELAFADAVRPARCVVLKLEMRPFSFGHEILLLRERNALVMRDFDSLPEGSKNAALVQAANICSQTWRENHFVPRTWLERRRSRRIWSKWERCLRTANWGKEIQAFKDYMRAGSAGPPIEPGDGPSGRDPGAPFHAGIIQFLGESMGIQEPECFDYPVGLGKFHYYTSAEASGAVRIINQAEMDFEEYCRIEDAKEAALKKQKEAPCQP